MRAAFLFNLVCLKCFDMSSRFRRYIDVLESRDEARKRELQDLKRRYRALKRQAKEGATATGAEGETATSSSSSPPPVKPPPPSDAADGAQFSSSGGDEVEESKLEAATAVGGTSSPFPFVGGLDEVDAEELKGEEGVDASAAAGTGAAVAPRETRAAAAELASPSSSTSRPPDVLIRGLAPINAQDVEEDLGAESFDSGAMHISDGDGTLH